MKKKIISLVAMVTVAIGLCNWRALAACPGGVTDKTPASVVQVPHDDGNPNPICPGGACSCDRWTEHFCNGPCTVTSANACTCKQSQRDLPIQHFTGGCNSVSAGGTLIISIGGVNYYCHYGASPQYVWYGCGMDVSP